MNPDFDWGPMIVPDDEPRLERAIGRFIMAWGVLERELDLAFPVVFRVNATLAACIYSNLGTKAKLDMLSSAVSMLAPILPKRLAARSHAILDTVGDWSGNLRNVLAHGQPIPFPDTIMPKRRRWALTRQSARKHYDVVIHPSAPLHWERRGRAVIALAARWRRAIFEMYRVLYDVSNERLDDVCGFDIRYHTPTPLRRRTRRTQSRRSSKDRQAKRARPPTPSQPPKAQVPSFSRRGCSWVWSYCTRLECAHSAAMALVPFMIRWGMDASSDKLRRCARCSRCGTKGATLRHPSWVNSIVGEAPFPT